MGSVFSNAIRLLGNSAKAQSPVLMTGAAVSGVFITAGLAVEATPGAMKDIAKAEEKKGERLTKLETLKVAGPHYVPAGISGLLTSASMILTTRMCLKQNSALAACIMAGQGAATDYQNKIIEVLGPEKEKEIRDKVSQDKIDAAPETKISMAPGFGKTLCYDQYSDRYFWSDIEEIRRGLNDFNHALNGSVIGLSLNTFYEHVMPSLDPLKYGDTVGFDPNDGLVELRYSSLLTAKGIPCLVVNFRPVSVPSVKFKALYSGDLF